jgi:hypothetical protein
VEKTVIIPGAKIGKSLAEAIPGYEFLGGKFEDLDKEEFIQEFFRKKGSETCTKEDLQQLKEISRHFKVNRKKKINFKRKRYGFELWKSIQKIWKYH